LTPRNYHGASTRSRFRPVNTQELRNDDRVTSDDTLLGLIGEVTSVLDLPALRSRLLKALRTAVPADWISLNDLGPDPETTAVIIEPPFPPQAHAVFARHAFDNPLVARYQQTQDGRAYRFSDVATRDELHATALYREFYASIGLEYQIALTLPHESGRILALALSRRDVDFSDAERDLLNAARPFLIQAYRNAIEHTRLKTRYAHRSYDRRLPVAEPSLADALAERKMTRRESEVLSWVATGRSNRAVAEILALSERTVQKHLEACFQKLNVHARDDAVTLAWSFVGTPRAGQPTFEPNAIDPPSA
jgi:DNA-binding CsgD family transcriptional regulator